MRLKPVLDHPLIFLLCLAACVGCAARGANVQQVGATSDRVIRREQLTGASVVYDALMKFRPQCLRGRSTQGMGPRAGTRRDTSATAASVYAGAAERVIALYVNGVRMGTAEDLRTMSVADVHEVECLTASEAAQLHGLNNAAGAILVRTTKQ